MDHLTKITELVTQISQTSASLGFNAATTGKRFIEPAVKLELETAHVQLMQMYESLLHSRDEYQKATDKMAAEHKVEREQLQAENERLKDLELTWRICYERTSDAAEDLNNEVKILQDDLKTSKEQQENYRSDSIRNAKLAVKYREQLQSKPALITEEVLDDFCKQPHTAHYVKVFEAGVRFAEKHHNIGVKE